MKTPCSTDSLRSIFSAGIFPVITVSSADLALSAANALLEGGVCVMEVTFRTPAAKDAIRTVREKAPNMMIGAGTLLNTQDLKQAVDAGATFAASPGFDPALATAARELDMPFFPGVCTPTEITQAINAGQKCLKFFPAEQLGGLPTVTAMVAPFLHLEPKIVAMGGITAERALDYLRLPWIVAIGASWVCPPELIASQNWHMVTERARVATDIVRSISHRGAVNPKQDINVTQFAMANRV